MIYKHLNTRNWYINVMNIFKYLMHISKYPSHLCKYLIYIFKYLNYLSITLQGRIQGRRWPAPGHPLGSLKNKGRMIKNKISFDPNILFIWTGHPLIDRFWLRPCHLVHISKYLIHISKYLSHLSKYRIHISKYLVHSFKHSYIYLYTWITYLNT
jgi:hypothetical protein